MFSSKSFFQVKSASEICLESLELFSLVKPPIGNIVSLYYWVFFEKCPKIFSFLFAYFCSDIIVIGTGDKVIRLDEKIHREMRKRRIALEVQDTVRVIVIYSVLKLNILGPETSEKFNVSLG